ncbi:hypothetical protein LEN26_018014 [Aphanomyces euteiches]|nr:hypothetical protein LEN26_018014 [Aphanomyces euteiches]
MDSTSDFYRALLQENLYDPFKTSPQKLKHKTKLRPLPRTPPLPSPPASNKAPHREAKHRLPHLEVRVLRRPRLFLNPSGAAEVGVEEILQLNEIDTDDAVYNPLALYLPKKCSTRDEIPLMPCFAQAHRCRLFEAEKWREPIRDRDKCWSVDELAAIQAVKPTVYPMTDGKLHENKWKASRQDNVQQLNRRGVMIDQSYVIVTTTGINIFGRVYGAGLQSKRNLVLDVYDPSFAVNHTLELSMDDLEDLFQDHKDLLAAGRKDDLVSGIVSMLYFEYPNDDMDGAPRKAPTLHINKEMKVSASKLRRIQRERQRLLEEEEKRLEALRLWTMPRRQRHRILATSVKMCGFRFTVTVHHFPNQIRNFAVAAYHPPSGTQYAIPVGLHHAGKLARVSTPPHQWTKREKYDIANVVVRALRLVRNGCGETALAIQNRVGFYNQSVALERIQTADSIAEGAFKQHIANAVAFVREDCYKHIHALQLQVARIEEQFAARLSALEATRSELRAKEQQLNEALDDLESKGLGDVADANADKALKAQQRQEIREKRQRLKHERAETLAQIKATQHDITTVLASQQAESAQVNLEIKERLMECEREMDKLHAETKTPFDFYDQRSGAWRPALGFKRLVRHKIEMGTTNKLVAGATALDGHRVRFTVWLLDAHHVQFDFYNPTTSNTAVFVCSKLAWCLWSKENKRTGVDLWSVQKEIPHFVVYPESTSPTAPRELQLQLETLATQLDSVYERLQPLDPRSREAVKCLDELKTLLDKRNQTKQVEGLYTPLVVALASRMHYQDDGQVQISTLLLDLPKTEVSTSRGTSLWCSCQVFLENHQVVFKVDEKFRNVHPYTDELVVELATESSVEMKIHLELIVASIQVTYAADDNSADDATLEFFD